MEITITITEKAKAQIITFLKEENDLEAKFRLYVGLSRAKGFEYSCTVDNEVNEDDLILKYHVQENEFAVLVDSMSIKYLNGAVVDCILQDGTPSLVISNPNAQKD